MKRIRKQGRGAICLCVGILLLCGMGKTAFAAPSAPCFTTRQDIDVSSRFAELFFGKKEQKDPPKETTSPDGVRHLCPGGEIFGVKISTEEVSVAQVDNEASGLRVGDRILRANGETVRSAADVTRIVRACGGQLRLALLREGEELSITLALSPSKDGYRLGAVLRDGTAGIGTVTFYDPQSGVFGGLGHGICDAGTGEVLPMRDGIVTRVTLGGVGRGAAGKPGELHGILRPGAIGMLAKNCACGVFGQLFEPPCDKEALPIATRDEVHEGDATILCTVHGGQVGSYTVRIRDIDHHSDETKSFTVEVTDKALIAITGGIVRGMSGSPILQDGRIIGAVTHVMISDPTQGYGIFIENMLDQVNFDNSSLQKAA